MDLRSKMSLDISGVTKNLSKVAADTATLARRMSSSFNNTKKDLADLNKALKVDQRAAGYFDTKQITPFKKMAQEASLSFNAIRSMAAKTATEIEARFDSVGALSTMSSNLKSFVTKNISGVLDTLSTQAIKVGAALSYLATSPLSALRAALQGVNTAVVSLTTKAMSPLISAIDRANDKLKKWMSNLNNTVYKGSKSVKDLTDNVKKSGIAFKDVARIVQGIMISKIFYSSLNSIREAVKGVWEFSAALEYSQLVYTNFFGKTEEAKNFTSVLQDFAAKTRFNFAQLNDSAQQLLAYGFKAKNLMYVLRGVSAAASISGDPAKVESISRALGQIYNKGKLMSEEIRQLNEANVPVFEILKQKLGLTAKQIQNIGDEAIPASTAINALIDGLNERFGGLLEHTNETIVGIASNIQDVWLQLAATAFNPFTTKIKSVMNSILSFLMDMQATFDASGIGGIFEKLVPPALQESVRLLMGSLIELHKVFKVIAQNLSTVISALLPGIVSWLNIILSAVGNIAKIFAVFTSLIVQNEFALSILSKALMIAAAAWLAYKVQALAAFISTGLIKVTQLLSKNLTALSNTLTKLTQHPFILMVVILSGLLLALTGNLDKVRNAVNGVLNSFNSTKTAKLLQPTEMGKSAESVDTYSEKLDGMSDALKDASDSANKASKAFLSFDEVFSNPDETTSEAGTGITEQWQNFLAEMQTGEFDPSTILEGINVDDFAGPFIDNLIESFDKTFSTFGSTVVKHIKDTSPDKLIIGGLTAVLTLVATGFTPAGIFVAIAAVIATAFWDEITKALGISPKGQDELLWAAMIGSIVAVFTKIKGGKVIASRTAVAFFAVWLAGVISDEIATAMGLEWDTAKTSKQELFSKSAFSLVGAVIGGLSFGLEGALAGVAIGTIVAPFAVKANEILVEIRNAIWKEIKKAIGMPDGESPEKPVENSYADYFIEELDKVGVYIDGMWADVASYFDFSETEGVLDIGVQIVKGIFTGIMSALATVLAVLYTAFVVPFIAGFKKAFKIESPSKEMVPIGEFITAGLFKGVTDALASVGTWVTEKVFTPIKTAIETAFGIGSDKQAANLKPTGSSIMSGMLQGVIDKLSSIGEWISKHVYKPILSAIRTAFGIDADNQATTLKPTGKHVIAGMLQGVIDKLSTIANWITVHVFEPILKAIKSAFGIDKTEDAKEIRPVGKSIVGGIFKGISDSIAVFIVNIAGLAVTVANAFDIWILNIVTKFANMMAGIGTSIGTWVAGLAGTISSGISDAIKAAGDFVGGAISFITGDTSTKKPKVEHATGGIFNREHVARFAEGNKAEAIIPLENDRAMQPFVDAVSNGITQSLAPILVSMSGGTASNNLPPMWVGALIADERGLKELKRKFTLIDATEMVRTGGMNG